MLFSEASAIVTPTKYWNPDRKIVSKEPLIYVSNSFTGTGESISFGKQVRLFSAYQTDSTHFRPLLFPKLRGKSEYQFAIVSQNIVEDVGPLEVLLARLNEGTFEGFSEIQGLSVPRVFTVPIKSNQKDWMPFLSQEVHRNVHEVAREYAERFAIESRLGYVNDLIEQTHTPITETATYKAKHDQLMKMANLRTNS